MVTTLSTQAARRYPQMSAIGWGQLHASSFGTAASPGLQLYRRIIRGDQPDGADDYMLSYQG